MNKGTFLLLAVVVLVVVVVGLRFLSTPAEAPVSTPTATISLVSTSPVPTTSNTPLSSLTTSAAPLSQKVTVNVDEQGFSETEITLPVGGTITFVNNGQGQHWPASGVHPTHEILPDFDPKRGLETGEEYSYTFKKVGTWGFHDHLNPKAQGTVTVQ